MSVLDGVWGKNIHENVFSLSLSNFLDVFGFCSRVLLGLPHILSVTYIFSRQFFFWFSKFLSLRGTILCRHTVIFVPRSRY